jgi:hypothetical protein
MATALENALLALEGLSVPTAWIARREPLPEGFERG